MADLFAGVEEVLVPPLSRIGRPLVIAEPFVGMGGLRQLFSAIKAQYDSVNVFDADPELAEYHRKVLEFAGRSESILKGMHIGPVAGDVRRVHLNELQDCDGVIMGTPCQPWAGCGARKRVADPRSDLTELSFMWITQLARRGNLLFFSPGELGEHPRSRWQWGFPR